MLNKLFRFGPCPQRILRGLVVAVSSSSRSSVKDVAQRVYNQSQRMALGAKLVWGRHEEMPHAVWIDSGASWMHTPRARRSVFSELLRNTKDLSALVAEAGGVLLPNAVKLDSRQPWGKYLVGDRHVVAPYSELERTVFTNLLREFLPELIALTGRSGGGPNFVEEVESRRLSDSSRHYAARVFDSTSSSYIRVYRQELWREQNVRGVNLLDVVPDDVWGKGAVEIRINDGQMTLASVRAQAILYQALCMKARRLAHGYQALWPMDGIRLVDDETDTNLDKRIALPLDEEEADQLRKGKRTYARRLFPLWQSTLEQNRSRAIARGVYGTWRVPHAKVRTEEVQDLSSQAMSEGLEEPPWINAQPSAQIWRNIGATHAICELLNLLTDEFKALEATYDELAPIVLGVTLKQAIQVSGIGKFSYPPLQNENDLLRHVVTDAQLARRGDRDPTDVFSLQISKLLTHDSETYRIVDLNNEAHRSWAGRVRKAWSAALKSSPTPLGEENAYATTENGLELALDLTQAARQPSGVADFVDIMDGVTPRLLEHFSPHDRGYAWRSPRWAPEEGPHVLRLNLIHVNQDVAGIDRATPLNVHSVIEIPRTRRRCVACGQDSVHYAPYACAQCGNLCCDEHATILDGNLEVFCPNCVPSTASGEAAAFWCLGPNCRDRVGRPKQDALPWPESQRHPHRHVDHQGIAFYCDRCHDELFSDCYQSGCGKQGVLYCEFVMGEDSTCDERMCLSHAHRWQVYGPQAAGLCLCERHRDLRNLTDMELLRQLALGTVLRGRRFRKFQGCYGHNYPDRSYPLPNLRTVQYIFHQTDVLNLHYELPEIRFGFEKLKADFLSNSDLSRSIDNRSTKWDEDINSKNAQKQEGRRYFEEAIKIYQESGERQLADQLDFSDYIQTENDKCIWVSLKDAQFTQRFRRTKRHVQNRIKIRIREERPRPELIFGIPRALFEQGVREVRATASGPFQNLWSRVKEGLRR